MSTPILSQEETPGLPRHGEDEIMIRTAMILGLACLWPVSLAGQTNLTQEIAKCAAIASDLERLVCFDALARTQGLDRPQSRAVPLAEVGSWQVRDQVNPLDDTRTVDLALVATGGAAAGDRPAILNLRCQSGETEVYINWRTHLGSGAQVATRIGAAEVDRRQWSTSSNQQATFYPRNDAVAFIKALMAADRLVAQVAPSAGNPITAAFDTDGLANAVKPLRQSCRW
jgi:type VI secretion system protein VasI